MLKLIKMKQIIPIFTTLILSLIFSCQSSKIAGKEEIQSVKMSSYGGMMGMTGDFIIRKDSIIYEHKLLASPEKTVKKSKATSAEDWNDLIRGIDLEAFKNAKSGESQLPIDGIDTKLTIETNLGSYSVVNGSEKTFQTMIERMKRFIELE